jgi:hypothetical protein
MKGNIAVVGCGPWGENLARIFFDLGVLAAIYDKSQKRYKLENGIVREIEAQS